VFIPQKKNVKSKNVQLPNLAHHYEAGFAFFAGVGFNGENLIHE